MVRQMTADPGATLTSVLSTSVTVHTVCQLRVRVMVRQMTTDPGATLTPVLSTSVTVHTVC